MPHEVQARTLSAKLQAHDSMIPIGTHCTGRYHCLHSGEFLRSSFHSRFCRIWKRLAVFQLLFENVTTILHYLVCRLPQLGFSFWFITLTGFFVLIYYPNWVFCSDLLPQLGFRHELYGRVKSIRKPIFGVNVESSFASMRIFSVRRYF